MAPSTLPHRPSTASNNPDEWSAGRCIVCYGVRLALRANSEAALERLCAHLPPLWKPASTEHADRIFSLVVGKSAHVLFEDSDITIRSRSLTTILEDFRVRVKAYVAEMARRRVFVHAGVVGWRGKAILIPGRSMSGKTSLVYELVRAGAAYYSDEYAVLDLQGRVHPYPQPLALRSSGSFAQRNRRVEELGGIAGDKPLPVGWVIVTKYRDNAHWRPRKVSRGQGVLELLAHTVPARRKPEIVIPTLHRAVAEGIILKGARGEARETATRILRP